MCYLELNETPVLIQTGNFMAETTHFWRSEIFSCTAAAAASASEAAAAAAAAAAVAAAAVAAAAAWEECGPIR